MNQQEFSFVELRSLRNASKGVKRVTKNLKDALWKIAFEISNLGSEGDSIIIAESKMAYQREYVIIEGAGGYNFLIAGSEKAGDIAFWTDDNFRIDGDWKCLDWDKTYSDIRCVKEATRDDYVAFAEQLVNIMKGFAKLWKDREAKYEDLFGKIAPCIAILDENLSEVERIEKESFEMDADLETAAAMLEKWRDESVDKRLQTFIDVVLRYIVKGARAIQVGAELA